MTSLMNYMPKFHVARQLMHGAVLVTAAALLVAIQATQVAAAPSGYKVFGDAGLSIRLSETSSFGATAVTFTLLANDSEDCNKLASRVSALERMCEKLEKDGGKRIDFSGTVYRSDERTFEGEMDTPGGGSATSVRLMVDNDRIAIAQFALQGGRFGSILTIANPAMFNRLLARFGRDLLPGSLGQEIVGYRLGEFTVAEVGITPGNFGKTWHLRFGLDAKADRYGTTRALDDCVSALATDDLTWALQCERTAKKAMPVTMSGSLEGDPRRSDAFVGVIESEDGARRSRVLLLNPGYGRFQVALTRPEDMEFRLPHAVLEFDTGVRPPAGEEWRLSELPARNWRVPQEMLPEIGFDMEATFEQAGPGLEGKAILWFRAEASEISGSCPNSTAMLLICERIQKDGPLEMHLSLAERVGTAAAGWRGMASPANWGYGPFAVDLFQGSSIPDWGSQDDDAFYMRFRSQDRQPGNEPVAWIKVDPLGREPVTIAELDTRGTFDRPPSVAPPAAVRPSN